MLPGEEKNISILNDIRTKFINNNKTVQGDIAAKSIHFKEENNKTPVNELPKADSRILIDNEAIKTVPKEIMLITDVVSLISERRRDVLPAGTPASGASCQETGD